MPSVEDRNPAWGNSWGNIGPHLVPVTLLTRGKACRCRARALVSDPALLDGAGANSATYTGVWERYDAWNEGIKRELFSGQWAGEPVYLDLEPDVLARIAESAQDDAQAPAEGLNRAVTPTLNPIPGQGGSLFAKHLARERGWQAGGCDGTPPFLAALAFLSLIAEGMRGDGEFRASNYYGRLAIALGVDPNDERSRSKIIRGFMNESHVLWSALNSWLEDNDGRFGLPTAYAFDYRVHVGVPMSQALVREADRLALRDLFSAYRLKPGQSLSRDDMLRILADWLPSSTVSAALRRLSEQREALERVADVALIELRAWNGTTRETRESGGPPIGDLLLSAVLRHHPRPQLHLELHPSM